MVKVKVNSAQKELVEKSDITSTLKTLEFNELTIQVITNGKSVLYRCSTYPKVELQKNKEYTFATGIKPKMQSATIFIPQRKDIMEIVAEIRVDISGVIHMTLHNNGCPTTGGINFSITLPI